MSDNLKLFTWIAVAIGALVMGYTWWFGNVNDCEAKGGVAVRGATGYTVVCIDREVVK